MTLRQDFIHESVAAGDAAVVGRPLRLWERLYNLAWLRQVAIIVALAAAWQIYTSVLDNALLFPTLDATLEAFWQGIVRGGLLARAWASLSVLLVGYAIGIALAFLLAVAAMTSRIGNDLLDTLTSMFNPLPAIALLPLALIWFGLGASSLVFVLIHSVMWPVALNAHAGFRAVSTTLRMVGRNYGLRGLSLVLRILLPAAFPSILAGLKIGWAFAWRTLIAAEMVYGVASGGGGLGWYIYENKNMLETANVFAGLLMVIIIGLAVENLVFGIVERRTVRRWGMQA
ncbi:MAG: Binding-protein-dependent transport system inner rane component [Rhodospirillales bacterium]|nr:Binding-protein-dependent transport system inner rane component [Rhodospirillales bacterium]